MDLKDDFITVHEAACRLSCSEETIRRLIRSGKLKSYKMLSQYRIKPQDIELSLSQSRNFPTIC